MDSGRGKSRKRKAPECWLQDGHSRGADQQPITIASLVGPMKPFNAAAGFVKGRKESDEKQAEDRRICLRQVRKKTIQSNERKQRELAQRHKEAVADLEKVQRQYDEATTSCEQRRAYEVLLRDKEVPRPTQNVTQLPSEQSPHVPLIWATEGQLEAEIGKESQRKVKGPPKTYELHRNLTEAKRKEVCMKKEKENFEKAVGLLKANESDHHVALMMFIQSELAYEDVASLKSVLLTNRIIPQHALERQHYFVDIWCYLDSRDIISVGDYSFLRNTLSNMGKLALVDEIARREDQILLCHAEWQPDKEKLISTEVHSATDNDFTQRLDRLSECALDKDVENGDCRKAGGPFRCLLQTLLLIKCYLGMMLDEKPKSLEALEKFVAKTLGRNEIISGEEVYCKEYAERSGKISELEMKNTILSKKTKGLEGRILELETGNLQSERNWKEKLDEALKEAEEREKRFQGLITEKKKELVKYQEQWEILRQKLIQEKVELSIQNEMLEKECTALRETMAHVGGTLEAKFEELDKVKDDLREEEVKYYRNKMDELCEQHKKELAEWQNRSEAGLTKMEDTLEWYRDKLTTCDEKRIETEIQVRTEFHEKFLALEKKFGTSLVEWAQESFESVTKLEELKCGEDTNEEKIKDFKQSCECSEKKVETPEKRRSEAVLDFDREKKEINDLMKSLQREKEAVEKLKKNNDRIDRELGALNGQFRKEGKEGRSEEFGEVTSYGIKFSLDEDFTEDLNDPKSEAYREVEGRVSDMMKRAIGYDLKEVVVIGFKNGSIEVTLKIIVKKDGNNVDDIKKKMQILEDEVQSSMKVQESSTAVVDLDMVSHAKKEDGTDHQGGMASGQGNFQNWNVDGAVTIHQNINMFQDDQTSDREKYEKEKRDLLEMLEKEREQKRQLKAVNDRKEKELADLKEKLKEREDESKNNLEKFNNRLKEEDASDPKMFGRNRQKSSTEVKVVNPSDEMQCKGVMGGSKNKEKVEKADSANSVSSTDQPEAMIRAASEGNVSWGIYDLVGNDDLRLCCKKNNEAFHLTYEARSNVMDVNGFKWV